MVGSFEYFSNEVPAGCCPSRPGFPAKGAESTQKLAVAGFMQKSTSSGRFLTGKCSFVLVLVQKTIH